MLRDPPPEPPDPQARQVLLSLAWCLRGMLEHSHAEHWALQRHDLLEWIGAKQLIDGAEAVLERFALIEASLRVLRPLGRPGWAPDAASGLIRELEATRAVVLELRVVQRGAARRYVQVQLDADARSVERALRHGTFDPLG